MTQLIDYKTQRILVNGINDLLDYAVTNPNDTIYVAQEHKDGFEIIDMFVASDATVEELGNLSNGYNKFFVDR